MKTFKKLFVSYSLFIISLLPLSVLYILADFLFFLLYHVIRYRSKVIDLNLQNAFPEKSEKERSEIKTEFYRFLADLIVECVKMRSISKREAQRRWHLRNAEELLQYLNNGQSVILVTGHYGNWEWGIHCLSLLSDHPALIVYKPLHDQVFEAVFNKMRSRFGAEMVPVKKTLRKIVSMKQVVHTSVFLADQTPAFGESDLFITFLNQDTLVYKGIERIAKITNAPVVYCHIDREKRGRYTCRFTTLVKDPRSFEENKITYIYNDFLEGKIREQPAFWLWSHKRWKHRKTYEAP